MRRTRSLARLGLIGGAAALVAAASGAEAADLTEGGALAAGSHVVLIEFTHPGGEFTTFTSGWFSTGPFIDSLLSLFADTGPGATFIEGDDDDGEGFSADVGGTVFTGGIRDALIQVPALAAGTYTLGLSSFSNFSAGPTLGDGYQGGGIPGDFRVHLLGITEILSVQNPAPVSISAPDDCSEQGCG